MSSHSIRSILNRLAVVESEETSGNNRHDLDSQHKSVPQLPALFKPRDIQGLASNINPESRLDSATEPRRSSLGETMQAVEEDMLSKVKRDLTTYLDQLEKRVADDRQLIDRAKDAVDQAHTSEEIETDVYHSKSNSARVPVQTVDMEDGTVCEVYEAGDDYEIKIGGRSLPSRFKNSDDAGMAIKLFQARLAQQQASVQDPDQDYIQER